MNSNWFKIIMKLNRVDFGSNLLLKGIPIIFSHKRGKIKIGSDVVIKSSFLSNLVGLYSRCIIVARTENATIEIGDRVGISGATIYARDKILIGSDTMIGGNVKILDNDFHPIELENRHNQDKNMIKSKPIAIGKNYFIGVNSIILKGTELGDNCVVGVGAVVAGKFDDANSVIAGNPAKIIKYLN